MCSVLSLLNSHPIPVKNKSVLSLSVLLSALLSVLSTFYSQSSDFPFSVSVFIFSLCSLWLIFLFSVNLYI